MHRYYIFFSIITFFSQSPVNITHNSHILFLKSMEIKLPKNFSFVSCCKHYKTSKDAINWHMSCLQLLLNKARNLTGSKWKKKRSYVMIKNFKGLSVVLLGAMIALAMTTNVFANWQSVNGSSCQAYNGGQEKYLRHWGTGVINRSNRSVMVTCPLVRNENRSEPFNVEVFIRQPPESRTRCYLQSSSRDGSVYTHRKFGKGDVNITWLNTLSGPLSMSAVRCLLPPGARIERINYSPNSLYR